MDFLRKHFGSAVSPQDFEVFMRAQTPRQLEKAVQRLIAQGIKKEEVSRDPFVGNVQQTELTLVDLKQLTDQTAKH